MEDSFFLAFSFAENFDTVEIYFDSRFQNLKY